jgi:hypothetical protein
LGTSMIFVDAVKHTMHQGQLCNMSPHNDNGTL